jgi:predicted transcriptional regulator
MMRTTLTLDDDVAARLERLRRARGQSLRDTINDTLRRGLDDLTRRQQPRESFRTESIDLGRLRLPSIDNISETLAAAEDETFK